jgi:hypothetical protein
MTLSPFVTNSQRKDCYPAYQRSCLSDRTYLRQLLRQMGPNSTIHVDRDLVVLAAIEGVNREPSISGRTIDRLINEIAAEFDCTAIYSDQKMTFEKIKMETKT